MMKKIILIVLNIFFINCVNAQIDTNINMRLKTLELNNEIIQTNLKKCHKQWQNGLEVTGFGLGASIVGSYMVFNSNNIGDASKVGQIFIGLGGLTSFIGTIIMLDSHRYIGKAGLSFNSNGLVYKFK